MDRRENRLEKLRARIRARRRSLADDFDYKIFYVIYYKDHSKQPMVYEAEKVGLSMTNNQEKAIMEGVRANAYSQSEATQLLHKDTVQIHAARWFSLGSECLGVVENMDLAIWPRVDLERMEILCFSRWKSDEGVPEHEKDPYRLMAMRFVMWQDAELSRNIIPYLAKVVRTKDKKGGILFNTSQNLGLWTKHDATRDVNGLTMTMTSMMLCFPQDELTRWHGDIMLEPNSSFDSLIDIVKESGRSSSTQAGEDSKCECICRCMCDKLKKGDKIKSEQSLEESVKNMDISGKDGGPEKAGDGDEPPALEEITETTGKDGKNANASPSSSSKSTETKAPQQPTSSEPSKEKPKEVVDDWLDPKLLLGSGGNGQARPVTKKNKGKKKKKGKGGGNSSATNKNGPTSKQNEEGKNPGGNITTNKNGKGNTSKSEKLLEESRVDGDLFSDAVD